MELLIRVYCVKFKLLHYTELSSTKKEATNKDANNKDANNKDANNKDSNNKDANNTDANNKTDKELKIILLGKPIRPFCGSLEREELTQSR